MAIDTALAVHGQLEIRTLSYRAKSEIRVPITAIEGGLVEASE